jgi:hypothetical protein
MDTPYTIRAQELKDIYNSINMKYLTQDERLDVLLTLKHTVKEHDCKLTQEITELIDREADLLMRGVREPNLDGLRKRISTLFLQYIKTPTFNPEAARLLKVCINNIFVLARSMAFFSDRRCRKILQHCERTFTSAQVATNISRPLSSSFPPTPALWANAANVPRLTMTPVSGKTTRIIISCFDLCVRLRRATRMDLRLPS